MGDDVTPQQRALGAADLLLLCDGQQIPVIKGVLMLASPVIYHALQCPARSGDTSCKRMRLSDAHGSNSSTGDAGPACTDRPSLSSLSVEGSYEGWTALLDLLYRSGESFTMLADGSLPTLFSHAPFMDGNTASAEEPLQLSPASACRILPIAHAYNMRGPMQACIRAVQQSELPLGTVSSSQPPADPQGPLDLFHWLSLADAHQSSPLVDVCMEQLIKKGGPLAVRSALAGRQSRPRLEAVYPGSVMAMLNMMARLPVSFKGITVPCLTKPPFYTSEVVASMHTKGVGCLVGDTLLLAQACNDGAYDIQALNTAGQAPGVLAGHTGAVRVLAGREHAAGLLAVSGSDDGTARLWRVGERQCHQVFDQHRCPLRGACFLDASRVATGGDDSIIRVWSAETGSVITNMVHSYRSGPRDQATAPPISNLKATADGNLLLSASETQDLLLWDLRSPTLARQLIGACGSSYAIGLSASGDMAVSAVSYSSLKVWDMGSGGCVQTMRLADGDIGHLCVDAACTVALTYGTYSSSNVHVWDLSRGELITTHTWESRPVACLAATDDLSKVAVMLGRGKDAGGNVVEGPRTVRVWATEGSQ